MQAVRASKAAGLLAEGVRAYYTLPAALQPGGEGAEQEQCSGMDSLSAESVDSALREGALRTLDMEEQVWPCREARGV